MMIFAGDLSKSVELFIILIEFHFQHFPEMEFAMSLSR